MQEDGTLVLAFCAETGLARDDDDPDDPDDVDDLARDLIVNQFVAALEIADDLAAFGDHARTAHPLAGMRATPDRWFGLHAQRIRDDFNERRGDWPEGQLSVALLAATGQFALPYAMAACLDGGLDFSWRPGHWLPVAVNPEVRVTVRQGKEEKDPAWVIQSRLKVSGRAAVRARWCADRNAELWTGDRESRLTRRMMGGWGLSADGECVRTVTLGWRAASESEEEVTWHLMSLLRHSQLAVVDALEEAPESAQVVPLTVMELAFGLDTTRGTFVQLLGDQSSRKWSAALDVASVLVLYGTIGADVPTVGGSDQLALLYSAFLEAVPDGRRWLWRPPSSDGGGDEDEEHVEARPRERDTPAASQPRRRWRGRVRPVSLSRPRQRTPGGANGSPDSQDSAVDEPAPGRGFGLLEPDDWESPPLPPRHPLQNKLDEWRPDAEKFMGSRADAVAEVSGGILVQFIVDHRLKDQYVAACSLTEARATVTEFNQATSRTRHSPGRNLEDV